MGNAWNVVLSFIIFAYRNTVIKTSTESDSLWGVTEERLGNMHSKLDNGYLCIIFRF